MNIQFCVTTNFLTKSMHILDLDKHVPGILKNKKELHSKLNWKLKKKLFLNQILIQTTIRT